MPVDTDTRWVASKLTRPGYGILESSQGGLQRSASWQGVFVDSSPIHSSAFPVVKIVGDSTLLL